MQRGASVPDAGHDGADAEDKELVRFEHADEYISKQSELLTLQASDSEKAAVLLDELGREVSCFLTPDQCLSRAGLSAGSILGKTCATIK